MGKFVQKHVAGLETHHDKISCSQWKRKALKLNNLSVHSGPTLYWLCNFGQLMLPFKTQFSLWNGRKNA